MGLFRRNIKQAGIFNVKTYKAPGIRGIDQWLNSEALTIAELNAAGKVVIIDFWTFGCYNCRNSIPHIVKLYEKYKTQGLEIIGIHCPEFDYEKDVEQLQDMMRTYTINYPVAVDNNFNTWKAYKNRYWPAFYFIDKSGNVRRQHNGEGEYDLHEQAVQQLLSET